MTLFEILDEMQSVAYPVVLPRVVFAVQLVRDVAVDPAQIDCPLRVQLGEEVLAEGVVHFNFENKARSQAALRIDGMVFMHPGLLTFRLLHEQRELARYDVPIVALPGPAPIAVG